MTIKQIDRIMAKQNPDAELVWYRDLIQYARQIKRETGTYLYRARLKSRAECNYWCAWYDYAQSELDKVTAAVWKIEGSNW